MKILMTADAVGGVWTYALQLSAALARAGVQVVLATMGPLPTRSQSQDAEAISGLRLQRSTFKLEWMEDPWADVERAGEWLLDIAAREAVDLVHLNGYVHAALPWQRPVICVAHSCVCSWWQAVHQSAPPAAWDLYRRKVTYGLGCADAIVAPTRAFAQQIRQWYRPVAPLRVIHNGRASDGYDDVEPCSRLPLIFACGRLWDEAKNMGTLDAALCGLPWHGYVAGHLRAPDGRVAQFSSLRALGPLPSRDVAAWMKRVAIFAHPSRYEPFGLAVLEAALAGCVLVLSDLPALRELWDGAAAFVDGEDVHSWRSALRALIEDPGRRQHLRRMGHARALQYGAGDMGTRYLKLYREMLAVHPHARVVA